MNRIFFIRARPRTRAGLFGFWCAVAVTVGSLLTLTSAIPWRIARVNGLESPPPPSLARQAVRSSAQQPPFGSRGTHEVTGSALASPGKAAIIRQVLAAPLAFEPNQGQVPDGRVEYLSHGAGYRLTLSAAEADLSLALLTPQKKRETASLRMTLPGARPSPVVKTADRMPGQVDYLLSRDPQRWHLHIPTFGRIRYENIYRGVDLEYHGSNQRLLEYDFIVAAGADPSPISMAFEGAQETSLDQNGDLMLRLANVTVRERRPVAYQLVDGRRIPVRAGFKLSDTDQVTFALGPYDHHVPLVIDPQIVWGDYLEASGGNDEVDGVAVAPNGRVVIVGTDVESSSAPSGDPMGQVYVTELFPDGTPLFRTFLADNSLAVGVAVDSQGNIYVAGSTDSSTFPTTWNAPIPEKPTVAILGASSFISGVENGFLTKLDSRGEALLYSTYIGGDGDLMEVGSSFEGEGLLLHKLADIELPWTINPGDSAVTGVAVDPITSRVYLSGWTESGAFPTTNNGGQPDAPKDLIGLPIKSGFVSVLDTTMKGADSIRYGSYLGAQCASQANAVAVDPFGDALVTGSTTATGDTASDFLCNGASFPTTPNAANGGGSGWVASLPNPDRATTNAFIFSTYLNGAGLAVAPGLGASAEVVEARGNLLELSQTSADGKTVTDQVALGNGSSAVITRRDVGANAAVLLAYNTNPNTVDIGRYTLGSGLFAQFAPIGGASTQAKAIGADTHSVYVGVATRASGLPSIGSSYGGGRDGYLQRVLYNPPPVLTGGSLTALTEGTSTSLAAATFTDASVIPLTGTAAITWGDGSSSTGVLNVNGDNSGSISASHAYPEEGRYTGTACVTPAGDTTATCAPFTSTVALNATPGVSVAIVAPTNLTIDPTTPGAIYRSAPGGEVAVTLNGLASIVDPSSDIYSATVDWGDGSGPQDTPVVQSTRLIGPASHKYSQSGTFKLSICGIDEKGLQACVTQVALTIPSADVSVTTTGPAASNECVVPTYQIKLTNNSAASAPNTLVTVQLSDSTNSTPTNETFTSAFLTGASGSESSSFVTTLPPDSRLSEFGKTLAIDGDTAAAGGLGGVGAALYQFDSHLLQWQAAGTLPLGDNDSGNTHSLVIAGDALFRGGSAPGDSSYKGTGFIYERAGSTWSYAQSVMPTDLVEGAMFGEAAALRGKVLAVGAPGETRNGKPLTDPFTQPDSGAVYIFAEQADGTWTQTQKIMAAYGDQNADGGENFGDAVAISEDGKTLFVGSPTDSQPDLNDHTNNEGQLGGTVWVYTLVSGAWTFQTRLFPTPQGTPPNAGNFANGFAEQFGLSLATSGNVLLVGAPSHTENQSVSESGAAYVFRGSGNSWTQEAKLLPSSPTAFGFYGSVVSMSGTLAVVGVDAIANDSQDADLFANSGAQWPLVTNLRPASGARFFGTSVAVSDGRILVGAPLAGQGAVYSYTSCLQTAPGTLSCNVGTLDGNHSLTFSVSVALGPNVVSGAPSSATAPVFVTATVESGAIDPTPANNVSAATTNVTNSNTVCVDNTAPVVAPTIGGTLGTNGWYTSDVSIHWNENDPESAITSTPCPDQRVTMDSLGTTASCTATSAGGSTSQQVTIMRDATPPSIVPHVVFASDGQTATITFMCSDGGSGVATCAPPVSLLAGNFVTATATDQAGNRTTIAVDVPRANAGAAQTVPLGAGCVATVQLNGGDSFDPKREHLTYAWSASFGAPSGVAPMVTLSPGIYPVTLTVTNSDGVSNSASTTITVQGPLPPVFTPGSVSGTITTPATGVLTPVSVPTPTATDSCPVIVSSPPTSFPEGRTDVLFTATDSAGNVTAASTTVIIVPQVDLAITTSTAPVVGIAGNQLTYHVTVSNAGPSTATQVSVSPQTPAGLTLVPLPPSAPVCAPNADGSTTCQPISLTASQVPAGCTLSGTALTCAAGTLPPNVNACSAAPGSSTCTPPVQYSQSGACTFMNGVLTCLPGQILTGTSVSFDLTLAIPPGLRGNQTSIASVVTNASVDGVAEETNLTNNSATSTFGVVGSTDLALALSAPVSAFAGAHLTETLTVSNSGPSDSTGFTITQTLPSGVTFVSGAGCSVTASTLICAGSGLPAGQTAAPLPVILAVDSALLGNLQLSATVTPVLDTDANSSNNVANATIAIKPPSVDLQVVMVAAPNPVTAGTSVNYALTVTNNGPSIAVAVGITQTLPAGVTVLSAPGCTISGQSAAGQTVSCSPGQLAVGASSQLTVLAQVSTFTRGTLTSTAVVSSIEADPDLSNNRTTATTAVVASADLQVSLTATPNPAVAGSALTYRIHVHNNGPSGATGLIVTDTLPAHVTLLPNTLPPSCAVSGNVVTCTAPQLDAGAGDDLALAVITTTAGMLTDTVAVSATEPDPNPGNNTASVTVPVSGPAGGPAGATDMNGDGFLDLVIADRNTDTVEVFFNDGHGAFTLHQRIAVGHLPVAVALGDLDGDGSVDVAVANSGSDNVSILRNDGTGTLVEVARPNTSGRGPSAIAAGDFRGAGHLALAVANEQSDTVSILEFSASGWSETASIPVSAGGSARHPSAIAAGDVNGDGQLDLVVANNVSATLTVLTNRGGVFTLAQELPLQFADHPVSLAVGDFDGNGTLDVAVVGSVHDSVTIAWNANGVLAEGASGIGVGHTPAAIATGDLAGDGRLDLAVADTNGNAVTVLVNGGGGFSASLASTETAGNKPIAVIVGDVDGDGRLDIIIVNAEIVITVLVNRTQ